MNKKKHIEVVAYDLNWPKIFETEAPIIQKALGNNCIAVHHVGSTAVPGLAAKPKIDIIAVVKNLAFPEEQLKAVGYTYQGGFNIPFRKTFTRRTGIHINLHIFEENDSEIELNLLFRDYLREHANARDEYQALKYTLLAEESAHEKQGTFYRGYTLGKNDFITDILKKTGFNKERFLIATHQAEWGAVKKLRNTHLLNTHTIEDPYTSTFDDPMHKHLVLYQGTEIIGYAHIQLWPDKRAAIRIIVIEETKRNNGFGRRLLGLCEKYLKNLGCTSLHAQVRPTALAFYKKNNYSEMPFKDPDDYKSNPQNADLGKDL